MKCPGCGRQSTPRARSCPKCGASLKPGARPQCPAGNDPKLTAIAKTAARLCGAHDALIFLADGATLRLAAHHGSTRTTRQLGEPFPLGRTEVYGRAVLERRVIHVRDLKAAVRTQYPGLEPRRRATGIRTMLAAPLLYDGAAIGAIAIRRTRVRPFTSKQIALVEAFAEHAATAIAKTRLAQVLAEALEQQTATSEILRVIAGSPTTLDPVLDAVVKTAARLCDASNASLFRVEGDLMRKVAGHGSVPTALKIGGTIPVTRSLVSGRAILERRTLHVPDLSTEIGYGSPEVRDNVQRHGLRTLVVTPLLRDGVPIGAITVYRTEVRPFSETQIALLQTFADQAVIAIENVRLFTELQARNRDLTEALEQQTATAEILRVISTSPTDLQPVLDAVVRNAARFCGADDAELFRLEGEHLALAAHCGPIPSPVGRPIPVVRGSVSGRAFAERRTIHVADVQAEAEEFPVTSGMARELGFRASLSVPLLREGTAVGTITLRRAEVDPFTDKQIKLLETFADQAVIAIENVRLFRDLTDALEQQTATAEILRAISSSPTDLRPVLETLVHAAARFCGARNVALLRLDGNVLRGAAAAGPIAAEITRQYGRVDAVELPATRDSVAGRSVVERRIVSVRDLTVESETEFPVGRELARLLGHRSTVATPLLREGVPVGAIVLFRTDDTPFSDRQLTLLRTFADQAVIAIENVRLFNDTKEALEQQTATSEILRVISRSPTDIQPVLDAVAESAALLCDALDVSIHRVDGDQLRLVGHHGPNPSGPIGAFSLPLLRGTVVGRAALDGQTVQVADLQAATEEYPEGSDVARQIGNVRTIVAVPLMRDGAAIGTLSLRRTEVHPFTDKQMALLQTFADQAVIAIENVRLFKELEARNRDLSEALEQQTATGGILRVISSSPTDEQPVFEAIVQSARRLCDASFSGVFLADTGQLTLAAVRGVDAAGIDALRHAYPRPIARDTTTGRAVLDRRLVHIEDSRLDPEYTHPLRDTIALRAILTVPIVREGLPIGAISVWRGEPRAFTDKQIALLQTFTEQAVIAIENVRLFKELEARNRDLTEALEQQTATSEILRVISESQTDVQPVFDTIVRSAARLCNAVQGNVQRFDGELMHVVATHGWTPATREIMRTMYPMRPDRSQAASRAVLSRAVVHIVDILEDNEYRHEVARAGAWRSILSVPMLREGNPVGVITVSQAAVGEFSETQIELLKTFAGQAVIAIENVRLFKELEARNRDLTEALEQQTATSEILRVISESQMDVQPVFDTIVRSAVRLCDGRQGNLQRFDGERMHYVASYNVSAEMLDRIGTMFPMRPDRSQSASRAVLSRTVVHIPDVLEDPEYTQDLARAGGHRSVLSVPMFREGNPIGVITVARASAGLFSESQVDLLRTFADQAVIAIENVRLFKELQARTAELTQSVEQLTALGEVSRAVSSTLDVETVLQTVVSRARQLAGADGCLIYEYDEAIERFDLRATDNLDPDYVEAILGVPIRKGEGVSGRAAEIREAFQVADITQPAAYQSGVRDVTIRAGYRAVLSVPLLREDEIIGSLILIRKTPGEFPAEIVEALKTFATQSALAIQNARLFKEIEEKGRQLEIASRHKSQFLANMSHELRTPLNAILGYTELLLDGIYGEMPDKARETMARIERSGRHLLALINDVLDLSKIEAGQLTLSLTSYSLREIVHTVVTAMEPLAAEKGLALTVALDPDLPPGLGDERRISQVLLNLVGNAIKFSKAGEVRIAATTSGGAFLLSVSDTGPGIAAEDQARIFEEFQQADTSSTREKGGTGLGLSISRRILALHGGRIWVESVPGRGSTFSFTLPVRVERMAEAS